MGGVLLFVILGSLIALAAFAFGAVWLLTKLSLRSSGLTQLAERYPTRDFPAGQTFAGQTVQVGEVRYRKCATMWLCREGLWLWVQAGLTQSGPLLIPWDEVTGVQPARLYGRKGARLSIGDPAVGAVTLYEPLFQAMSAYLPPTR